MDPGAEGVQSANKFRVTAFLERRTENVNHTILGIPFD
jgi:hypothetical protein